MRIRSMMTFLAKHIPGNPNISTEYMPGAGGRKAANHIYRARPDGLTILSATSGLIPSAIMGETGVLYDIDKLIYLGTPYSEFHAVFFTRKVLGLETIDKLRVASRLRVGAQSVGHATYREGRIFSYLLG
jgi:tripartite-type tricarboxylate transporter receptor subunit TctC